MISSGVRANQSFSGFSPWGRILRVADVATSLGGTAGAAIGVGADDGDLSSSSGHKPERFGTTKPPMMPTLLGEGDAFSLTNTCSSRSSSLTEDAEDNFSLSLSDNSTPRYPNLY